MTTAQLQAALRATPFRPFVLHMADGHEILVGHPELVVATESGRTTVVVQPDDTLSIVDLLLVSEIKFRTSTSEPWEKRG